MLTTSYDALRLFQKKISQAKNLQDIKQVAIDMDVTLSLGISPRSVWIASWDVIQGNLSGVMEFSFTINFGCSFGNQEWSCPFRYEDPKGISLKDWEAEIFKIVYNEIKRR